MPEGPARHRRLQGAPVELTQAEFKKLGEYSCTLPTGTTIGRRWKCNKNAFQTGRAPDWWLGEYIRDPTPGMVGILWRPIVILTSSTRGGDR